MISSDDWVTVLSETIWNRVQQALTHPADRPVMKIKLPIRRFDARVGRNAQREAVWSTAFAEGLGGPDALALSKPIRRNGSRRLSGVGSCTAAGRYRFSHSYRFDGEIVATLQRFELLNAVENRQVCIHALQRYCVKRLSFHSTEGAVPRMAGAACAAVRRSGDEPGAAFERSGLLRRRQIFLEPAQRTLQHVALMHGVDEVMAFVGIHHQRRRHALRAQRMP